MLAGLGVLTSVLMLTRERVHDLGIFKALGMTLRQTVTMVTCWVAVEVGFEPTEGLPPHTLSRRAPSATRRLHRRRAYPNPRVFGGMTYPASGRRAAKKSRSKARHSPARTPPMTSGRWFRRVSLSTSQSDPTAPALGSSAP